MGSEETEFTLEEIEKDLFDDFMDACLTAGETMNAQNVEMGDQANIFLGASIRVMAHVLASAENVSPEMYSGLAELLQTNVELIKNVETH